jgi:16S rRNA (guanine966-N2)-methyltransferase
LRIIAGEAKGRSIISPLSKGTRPTSDRVKESLFNILGSRIPDSKVLDLFAGTGNLGLESISRGAEHCIFIDNNKESIKTIYENIRLLKYEGFCEVYLNDALSALSVLHRRGLVFDIIFVDPPYHMDMIPGIIECIMSTSILKEGGIIAAEHDTKDIVPDNILNAVKFKSSVYGDTILSFYKTLEE